MVLTEFNMRNVVTIVCHSMRWDYQNSSENMWHLPVAFFCACVLFCSPEAYHFLFSYYCTESALGIRVENAALSWTALRVNFVCLWTCDATCCKTNVLLICSYCIQESKVKQRLYVLGMQIIFIAFHLKLGVW